MWKCQKRSSRGKNYQDNRSSLDSEPKPLPDKDGGEQKNNSEANEGRSGRSPKSKKARPNSSCCGKGRANSSSQRRMDIKIITSKIQRLMPSVQKAVNSDDAHEPGVSRCWTCEISTEDYKTMMQQIKIIEGIVSEVVEKEQREMMNAEDEEEDLKGVEDDSEEKSPPKKGNKQIKCSLTFQMYCEKPVSKHNLKCLLITLQKMMGDTMAQICLVKSRNLSEEERFKHFDVSVSDLNLFKYQLTGLTDDIILLIKSPPEDRDGEGKICVACVKEKVVGCTERLRDVLMNGRSLRLVRNEDRNGEPNCCPRTYPHIHARVHGKPIVFKYYKPPEQTVKVEEQEGEDENETEHGEEMEENRDEAEAQEDEDEYREEEPKQREVKRKG